MRFEVLDSWRGVCALMVAAMHYEALHHAWDLPLLRNGYLFVDFFFVLSGFVISHAYAGKLRTSLDGARFMVRRLGRVWPLHVALLCAYLAVETGKWVMSAGFGLQAGQAPFAAGGRVDLATLPSQLLLLQGMGFEQGLTWNMPSWSISVEFWTYLLFALVAIALPRMRTAGMAILGAVALLVLAAFSDNGLFATYDFGFPRAVLGFAFGHVAWRVRDEGLMLPAQSAQWMEWALLLAVVTLISLAGTGPLAYLAPLLFAVVVFVYSFEGGAVSKLLQTGPLQKLGLWSYSIYMVHDLVMYVIGLGASVAQRLAGIDIWRDVPHHHMMLRVMDLENSRSILDLVGLIYLAIVIALASLTYRLIEDPARRAFNRLSDHIAVPRAA